MEGIHFEEGATVKAGAQRYTIESQPYEAEVAAKINLAKAASDLARYRPLAARNAVSQSDPDATVAAHDAAKASVDAANANLRASQIQRGYTKSDSPITGIIGPTTAKVGAFVGQSPNPERLRRGMFGKVRLVAKILEDGRFLPPSSPW